MTETITRDELTAALTSGPLRANAPDLLAAEIFEHVISRREPRYEPGCAYEDAEGTVFLRSEIGDWVDRSGGRWNDATPVRPLRKLVPGAA